MAAGFRWTVENDASGVCRWLDDCGFGGALPSTAVVEVAFGKASQSATHRGIPQGTRFIDCQVDAVVAGHVGHRSILLIGGASVPPDRKECPSRSPGRDRNPDARRL